jgi:hypothetical protein
MNKPIKQEHQMNKSESIGKLATALAAAQADFANPVKLATAKVTSSRGSYSYDYATLPDVLDLIRPTLHKHGLSLPNLIGSTEPDSIVVEAMLLHESGEWISTSLRMKIPEKRTADGKAIPATPQDVFGLTTYARRYLNLGLCGISGADDDDANVASNNTANITVRTGNAPAKSMNEVRQAVVDPGQTHSKAIAALIAKGATTEQAETIIGQVLRAAGKSSISEVNNADAFIAALVKKLPPAKPPLVESPASFAKYVASKSRPSHLSPDDAARAVLAYLESVGANVEEMNEAERKLYADTLIEMNAQDMYPEPKTAKAAKSPAKSTVMPLGAAPDEFYE